jgi:NAD+-dependent protein deacetylase SIR2
MMCHTCRWTGALKRNLFHGPSVPSCQQYEQRDTERIVMGKRSIGISRLRPKMLLYEEADPDDTAFDTVSLSDLGKGPDAVTVA